MNSPNSYIIIEDHRLIVEYYTGDTTINDIMQLKDQICQEDNYDPTYSLIHDFTDANFKMSRDDLHNYCDYLKNKKELHGKRYSGYLTGKPNEVVWATLFSELMKNWLITPMVFSTTTAIVTWLNDEKLSVPFLEQVLEELKKVPYDL